MGLSKFKKHFNIEHIVHQKDKGVCIGSAYVNDIATIDPLTGKFKNRDSFSDFIERKYPMLASADPKLIMDLLSQEDELPNSIPVFYFDGSEIIEKKCEVFGWPNTTHDGELMYDNVHFLERTKAIENAIQNLRSEILWRTQDLDNIRQKYQDKKLSLTLAVSNLEILQDELDNKPNTPT